MSVTPFYPKLIDILPIDKLPAELGNFQQDIQVLLNDLYYSNLHREQSAYGDAGFYRLDVVSYDEVSLEVPGTNGLALVLNPGITSGMSVFPISLSYRWRILRYLREFSAADFSGDPLQYFNIILNILNLDAYQMISEVIDVFIDAADPLEEFKNKFNALHPSTPLTLLASDSRFEIIEDIIDQLGNIPGLDIFETLFNDFVFSSVLEEAMENLKKLFQKWLGAIDLEDIKDIFIPKFSIALDNLSLGLRFPTSIFRQADEMTLQPLDDGMGGDVPSTLLFTAGRMSFSTEKGFEFENESSFSFPFSEILRTGFFIKFSNMKLDLSRKRNIPEANADGRPEDFIGAYIGEAEIVFPSFWNHDDENSTGVLVGRNLLVGTGGISGTIGLEAKTNGNPAPLISARLGSDFKVSLTAFNLTFQQNAIIASEILGTLEVPVKDANGDPALIDILIHIGQNGEFYVTAVEEDGIPIPLGNIADIVLKSVTIGREDGRFFLGASGVIDFQDQSGESSFIGDNLPKDITVQKLVIWDDGEIELDGGEIVLAKPITLKLGPVALSITAIGFGSHEQMHEGLLRKYKYFEFSGGVSVNPGGVDARGDGVQFYFTVDNNNSLGKQPHVFVRIRGIAIDIIIPGSAKPEDAAVLLKGYLAMKEPSPGNPNPEKDTEYIGGIEFSLPKLKMGGSAAMRLKPKIPAFVIDIGLELSTPILLGSTGLGIYGFRGLLGQKYVASKTGIGLAEDAEWWQYYKKKVAPDNKEGVTVSKMSNQDGFSLGAGVSLATAADSGKAFSSKIFFLLSLPEVFLLQGQAQLLKERIGLDTTSDPPFFALIAISKTSVEAAFGVTYKLPDDSNPGKIADINALIELGFFFGNSTAWYLNIGRDLPADRRVTARLFTLFDAYAYFMLSSGGIKAGAGVSFGVNKKFGPLRAELSAYLDVAGRIAFRPKQIGGSIQLGGAVGLYIFKFGFRISVAASLAAEAPKPFIVTGSLEVCVRVLKKDRCAKFEFTWSFDSNLDQSEIPILDASQAAKALNVQSREPFPVLAITGIAVNPPSGGTTADTIPALGSGAWSAIDDYIIPLDSYIDIEFKKGVNPSGDPSLSKFGGVTAGANYITYVPPQRGKSDRVRHDFLLNKIEIFSWDPLLGKWAPYDVYAALTPLQLAPFIPPGTLTNQKYGYWQLEEANKFNKLRVLAQDVLSFMTQGSPGGVIPEELGITNGTIFCGDEPIEKTCINFDGFRSRPGFSMAVPANELRFFLGILFRIVGEDASIVYRPWNGHINALALVDDQSVEVYFQEPMACVTMELQTIAHDVTIKYFRRELMSTPDSSNMPQYEYVLVETKVKTPAELSVPVVYDDINAPVDHVIIESGVCPVPPPPAPPFVCDADITAEAKALENFLNMLVKLRHLTLNFFRIYPDFQREYDRVFMNSPLYPEIKQKDVQIFYNLVQTEPGTLSFNIRDTLGYNCIFTLKLVKPDPKFDFRTIIAFQNLRPDPASLGVGANRVFLIDAIVQIPGQAPFVVEMRGETSCYTITNCYDRCSTYIYQFCYLPVDDYLFNQTIPSQSAVSADNDAMLLGIQSSLIPIWRPHTHYAIRIETNDKLYRETSSLTEYRRAVVFGFRTAGPVGHFHQYVSGSTTDVTRADYQLLLDKDQEDQYKLSTLRHYIDYSKSYPNADGNLINAKPLFYGDPELLLFYRFSYVYEFFQDWSVYNGGSAMTASLEAVIKDPIEPPADAFGQPTIADKADTAWAPNDVPVISADIAALNNMIQNGLSEGEDCLPADTSPLTPTGVNTVFSTQPLEPLKLYTAIFNARFKVGTGPEVSREVHRYGFQTSRYADFTAQLNSYRLLEDAANNLLKAAVFDISTAFIPADIGKAQSILAGTLPGTDPLMTEAALPFDRLVDRVFGLGSLMPALTTEFNLLRDANTGNVLGILVRNPEPFADPKMPETVLLDALTPALQLAVDTGSGYGSPALYKVLWSKDRSKAFVTNADNSLDVPSGDLKFRFRYHLYNGTAYAVVSSVDVIITLS